MPVSANRLRARCWSLSATHNRIAGHRPRLLIAHLPSTSSLFPPSLPSLFSVPHIHSLKSQLTHLHHGRLHPRQLPQDHVYRPKLRVSLTAENYPRQPQCLILSANCPSEYSDHITELNNTAPKQPFFFLKPPSSILLPGAGPILRPKGVSLHYEVELGVVIGKTLRDLDPADHEGALAAIQSE